MQSTATKYAPDLKVTPVTKPRNARFPGGKVLPDHIATAAYYRAQARGFEPGREIQDWLDAEAELLTQAAEHAKK